MSPSSKRSKKPAVTLSKVPSVKEICERLGFQHASLKDTNAFTDATHAWRKSYKTSNGTAGTELLLWNELSVQLDLTIMAERFLEDKGNGERFWSPTRSWNHDSDVKYPEDRPRIIELLKQLFWKQNRYAANNNAYAHKGVESRDGSRDRTTPIHQITEVEGKTLPARHSHADPVSQHQARGGAALTTKIPPFSSPMQDQGQIEPKATNQSHVTGNANEIPRHSDEKDVYEVSDDDNDSIKVSGKLPKSPVLPSKHVIKKRSTTSRDTTPRKKLKFSLEESRRRTDRKRVRPDRPGIVPYVSDALYEEIMRTPPPIQDPALRSEFDEWSKVSLDKQKSSFEETLVQVPVSMKSYTAPTAPMVVPNQIDDPTSPLTGSLRVTHNPKSSSKPQVNSSSPQNQQSKVVRLSVKRPKTAKPPPANASVDSSVQATVAPGIHRTAVAELADTPQLISQTEVVSPSVSNSSDPVLQPTPATPFAGLDPSSEDPQPADEANQPSPPIHNGSIQQLKDQEISRATTAEIKTNSKALDPAERLKMDQGGRSSSAEKAPAKARSKTQVPLWIITREPRYTEERWIDGKFQGAQLSDFLEEVSRATQRDHIEKLKLTLRTPTFDTKITVFKGDEDEWIAAKKTFVEKLKEAMAEAKLKRSSEPASFKIFVEPFYEESSLMASNVDEDDMEFAF